MRNMYAHIKIEYEPARCNTLKFIIHTNSAYVVPGLRQRSSLVNHLPLTQKKIGIVVTRESILDLLECSYKN